MKFMYLFVGICISCSLFSMEEKKTKSTKQSFLALISCQKKKKKEKPVPTNAQSKNQNNIYKEIKIKKSSKKNFPVL